MQPFEEQIGRLTPIDTGGVKPDTTGNPATLDHTGPSVF
jgi:hypothetical protein